MSIPKDTHKADRVGAVKLARVLSNVISPPTMFAGTGLALGVYERGWWPGFAWGAFYAIVIALTPMLAIVYLLRTGRIGDLHMSATHERHIPYLTAAVSGAVVYALLALLGGPALPDLCETSHGQAFVLQGASPPRLLRLRYGEPDPPPAEGCL